MSRAESYLSLCLLDALEDECLESLQILLQKHRANPNTIVRERNVAPIHLAVATENPLLAERATELMLQHGADANLRSEREGMTPLHVAAYTGRARLVELLLKAGGDLEVKDFENKTPVQYAIEECHFEATKIMQNFVFEQKFERKREQLLRKELSSTANDSVGFVRCLGGYVPVGTPGKTCLSTVQSLEATKLTPNRLHYNFDATSPYYINITHRKKDRTKNEDDINQAIVDADQIEEHDVDVVVNVDSSDEDCVVMGRKNLFELTERNLANFSKTMKKDSRRSSFIECWRDKIARLRLRHKLSTNIDDIDQILSGFSLSAEDENDQEAIVVDDETCSESETEQSLTFKTAVEAEPPQYEDSLKTNEFALALCPSPQPSDAPFPDAQNRIVQITEEYIHTDDEAGLVFCEKRNFSAPVSAKKSTEDPPNQQPQQRNASLSSLSTVLTLPPLDYDTDALRVELTNFGEPPGPITQHTKKLYLKKLVKYKRDPERALAQGKAKLTPNFSVELLATLRSEDVFNKISDHHPLEVEMSSEFNTTAKTEKTWREGHLKKSFIYLLIDPRMSENLPVKQNFLQSHDLWKRFLQSIFYVGKGKSSRPYCHLYDAMKLYHQKSIETTTLRPPDPSVQLQVEEEQVIFQSEERIERVCRATKILNRKQMKESEKLNKIIDIWRAQQGVICLHVFHNIMPSEAYTREAAIIDALGIQNLTNLKRGDYYGKSLSWPMKRRKQLGILLLYKAMLIFLAEGETQLLPSDLI